ncbi:MAG: tetratricopeptide repeat protein, partial [Chthoniobacteraceae bacterium]
LVKAHPEFACGWCVLGGLQLAENMPATALTALKKSSDLDPNYAPSWNSLGLAYTKLQQLDQATDCFARAIKLEPGNAEVLNNLGYTYFLMGKTDEAIEQYKLSLQSDPKSERPLVNLVSAYARKSQWALARQTCDALARINPEIAAQLSQSFPAADRTSGAGSAAKPQ